MLHFSQDVINFNSPLDSYSAFKFENFLQYLKKLSRNNYRVSEQIRNRFFEKFFIQDYQGDFKKPLKRNQSDGFGNITDIHIYDMRLSVKAPTVVFKIEKIFKNDESFDIVRSRITNVLSFYQKPIPSHLLNIYVSDSNTTIKKSKLRVTKDFHKVARVESNGKCFF